MQTLVIDQLKSNSKKTDSDHKLCYLADVIFCIGRYLKSIKNLKHLSYGLIPNFAKS